MRFKYLERELPPSYEPIVAKANELLEGYARSRIQVTLRSLYYRFIALDLFPESWIDEKYNAKQGLAPNTKNTIKNYKRLGEILNLARMVGRVDWAHLQDITRTTDTVFTWDEYEGETPADILRGQADSFSLDKWSNSPWHLEVMVEKDAVEGYIKPTATTWGVPFTSNRGYASVTAQRDCGLRMSRAVQKGKKVVVLYHGDHDPSGIDMSREMLEKLHLFGDGSIVLKRLALNMDQVEQYGPPANPAKLTDSRAAGYIEEHGEDSWELDALDPQVLADLTDAAIREYVDDDLRAIIERRERVYKRRLHRIADTVEKMLEESDEDFDDEEEEEPEE